MDNIDLNCDMGESYGRYTLGNDQEIIKYVSSINIACGFHAGDPATMDQTVKLAIQHEVNIGAHPGLPDLNGFGRRNIDIEAGDAYQLIIYQVGALLGFIKANGGALHHVKPHGALYHMASKDTAIAEAIAKAVHKLDPYLTLFGLANSKLIKAGEQIGLSVKHEVFADRTYQSDGSLTPRNRTNAILHDEQQAIQQALQMIKEQSVNTLDGKEIPIKADTICIHGDHPNTLSFVKKLKQQLKANNIKIG